MSSTHTDGATSSTAPVPRPPVIAGGWIAVLAAACAIFMAMLDMTIVTAVLPTIGARYGVGPASTQWLLLAYAGTMTALLLPAGRWLDGCGTRAGFFTGVSGFAVISALIALAPAFPALVVLRVLQGAFAALLTVLVPRLVVGAVPRAQIGRAISVVGVVGPLGAVAGPPLGTLLTATLDWRWIFLVNVPISALTLALAYRSVAGPGGLTRPALAMLGESVVSIGAGAALFTTLTLAGSPSPGALWVSVLAAVTALAVGLWLRLPGGRTVRGMVADRRVARGFGIQLLLSLVGGAMLFLPPFSVTEVLHLTAATSGVVLLATPLAMSACGPLGGLLGDRWGMHRAVLLGVVVAGIGSAAVFQTGAEASRWAFGAALAVVGAGLGLAAGPNQAAVMQAVPHERAATAGAVTGLARQLGFALAPALTTLVWLRGGGTAPALGTAYLVPLVAAVLAIGMGVAIVRRETPGASRP